MKRNTRLVDVARLLRSRVAYREYQTEDASRSVPAFLAWKAFLIVAKTEDTATERSACQAAVLRAVKSFPDEVIPPLLRFAKVLRVFESVSPAHFADWFVAQDDDEPIPGARERRSRIVMRDIRELQNADFAEGAQLQRSCDQLGHQLYNVRSAVLAHVSVLSTGNAYQVVVPAFEDVAATLALAGWATLNHMPFTDAAAEAGVA